MRYDPIRTIERRGGDNLGLCETTGCGKRRHGVSYWCAAHMKARRVHGHPKGRQIHQHFYARELREATRYIAESSDPQLRAALAHIRDWLRDSQLGKPGTVAMDEMARLARHGVEPARLLAEWLALIVYARRNPQSLPDDVRLDFALANRIARLAPRAVRRTSYHAGHAYPVREYAMAPKCERAALGAYVRRDGPFSSFLYRAVAEFDLRLNKPSAP